MICIEHLEFVGLVLSVAMFIDFVITVWTFRFEYCSSPNCGCGGSRNCDAPSGASDASLILNREKGSHDL